VHSQLWTIYKRVSDRERDRERFRELTLLFPRLCLDDILCVSLEQLDIRSQTCLTPISSGVSPPREHFEFEQEFSNGRNGVRIEIVDLRSEDRDTDFA